MNPESPKPAREELEARITALLLGELSAEDAASLRETIAQDATLSRLHDQLKQTIALVRETATSPSHESVASTETFKLSNGRREKLLQSFKISRPNEFKPRRSKAERHEWVAVAAMALGLLIVAGIVVAYHGAGHRFVSVELASRTIPQKHSVEAESDRFDTFGIERRKIHEAISSAPGSTPSSQIPSSKAVVVSGSDTISDTITAFTTPLPAQSVELYNGAPQPLLPGRTEDVTTPRATGPATVPAAKPVQLRAWDNKGGAIAPGVQGGSPSTIADAGREVSGGIPPPTPLPVNGSGLEGSPIGKDQVTAGGFISQYSGSGTVLPLPSVAAPVDTATPTVKASGASGQKPQDLGLASVHDQLAEQVDGGRSDFAQRLQGVVRGSDTQDLGEDRALRLGGIKSDDSPGSTRRFFKGGSMLGPLPTAPPPPVMLSGDGEQKSRDFGLGGGGFGGANTTLTYNAFVNASVSQSEATRGFETSGILPRPTDFSANLWSVPGEKDKEEKSVQALLAQGIKGIADNSNKAERKDAWGRSVAEGDWKKPMSLQAGKPQNTPGAMSIYDVNAVGYADAAPQSNAQLAQLVPKLHGDSPAQEQTRANKERVEIALPKVDGGDNREKPPGHGSLVVSETNFTSGREAVAEHFAKLSDGEKTAALKRAFSTASPDQLLGSLLERQTASEEKLAKLTNNYGSEHPDVTTARTELEGVIRQLNERATELLSAEKEQELKRKQRELNPEDAAATGARPAAPAVPQPEVSAAENPSSTFSFNVSDVSFKLAAASLEKGVMPDVASVRSEEFINAFDYRDAEPPPGTPISFHWERARYPFAHNRDMVRFSIKTAASGRQSGRPLNLVLLLDNSGSMERADRVRIIQQCLRVLSGQLQAYDRVSVVAFSRTARLWVDGLSGSEATNLVERVGGLAPQGGTNLEDAMNLAYATALRHYLTNGVNRVVLLTDGAANLGDVDPESLKKKVEAHRLQGIALDCFGIGWEGYNDDLLEVLSRNGDGRYGFVNTPEAAATEFAGQLAGALKVAASDVKVQVEFNPRRISGYRQIGYAKHQLKKEQFRDNTVDAAEIGAAEAGNALYVVQVEPHGEGPLATVRVRYKTPGTTQYHEHEWPVPYTGTAKLLEQSGPALRLATVASAFSEWLVSSPYAAEVTLDQLLTYLAGVPETCQADPRPRKLEWMIRQAKSISGR